MKLKLEKPKPGDKTLRIVQQDTKQQGLGLCIWVDFDDVHHPTVLLEARRLVRIVNSQGAAT